MRGRCCRRAGRAPRARARMPACGRIAADPCPRERPASGASIAAPNSTLQSARHRSRHDPPNLPRRRAVRRAVLAATPLAASAVDAAPSGARRRRPTSPGRASAATRWSSAAPRSPTPSASKAATSWCPPAKKPRPPSATATSTTPARPSTTPNEAFPAAGPARRAAPLLAATGAARRAGLGRRMGHGRQRAVIPRPAAAQRLRERAREHAGHRRLLPRLRRADRARAQRASGSRRSAARPSRPPPRPTAMRTRSGWSTTARSSTRSRASSSSSTSTGARPRGGPQGRPDGGPAQGQGRRQQAPACARISTRAACARSRRAARRIPRSCCRRSSTWRSSQAELVRSVRLGPRCARLNAAPRPSARDDRVGVALRLQPLRHLVGVAQVVRMEAAASGTAAAAGSWPPTRRAARTGSAPPATRCAAATTGRRATG